MTTFLNDTWSFYFHDPYDNNWTNESYTKVCDIGSAEDYWMLDSIFEEKINRGTFFLMREHIFPCWDDAANITGGCISLKVGAHKQRVFWNELVVNLLTETLIKQDILDAPCWETINGISSTCRKGFCIIKIWIGKPIQDYINVLDIPSYEGDILYSSNMENIHKDNTKPSATKR